MRTIKKRSTHETARRHAFPTLKAAAAALGVPLDALRAAKSAGAAGFAANGNVDLQRLAAWLLTKGKAFTPPPVTLEAAKARLATARAVQLEKAAAAGGSDETVSLESAKGLLGLIVWWWTTSVPSVASNIALQIDPARALEVGASLESAFQYLLLQVTQTAVGNTEHLPEWLVAVVHDAAKGRRKLELDEFNRRVASVKDFLGKFTADVFADELAELRHRAGTPAAASPAK